METIYFQKWLNSKLELATLLVEEKGEEAEPDAQILLCCAISGFAAVLWPGTGLDRQRFIQLLIEFSPIHERLKRISTPVLASNLRNSKNSKSAKVLSDKYFPGHPTEMLDPEQVDRPESEIISIFPSLKLKKIRKASYASIIYTDLRCALVHEYSLSPNLTDFNLFGNTDTPTYVNIQTIAGQRRRVLHLPINYIKTILKETADNLFEYWASSTSWTKPIPSSWWADGKKVIS